MTHVFLKLHEEFYISIQTICSIWTMSL